MRSLTYVEIDIPGFAPEETDFGGDALGVPPADFTSRWNADTTADVTSQANLPSGQGPLIEKQTANARVFWSWDHIQPAANVDAIALIRPVSVADEVAIIVRGGGGVGTETAYRYGLLTGGTSVRLARFVSGTFTSLETASFAWSLNANYMLRLRATGDQLQAKAWAEGDPEPEAWLIQITDDTIPDAGLVGAFIFDATDSYYLGSLSVLTDETLRFAKPNDYLPRDIEAFPSIRDVSFTPGTISLGKDLGQRATLRVTFDDHKHIFDGEPFNQGTFWGKFRGRYGLRLRGRSLRLIQGLAGQSLAEMETRHYIMESSNGPDPQSGVFEFIAKDVLKLADGDRAQAPRLSNGFLVTGIGAGATSATLSPSGIGNAEYPASGHVAIGGEEICAFTRSGDVLTFETDDSPPESGRGQLGTTAVAHDAEDRVQLCVRYVAQDPADIISDLFTTYADVPSSFIPLSAWKNETENFLARLYTTTIADPTSVNKLVSELIEQAGLMVWWDDLTQQIRLQVLRAISTEAEQFTEDNTLESSLSIREQPDTRISQVWTYFGQRNPLEPVDEPDNYRSTARTVDLGAETDFGGPAVKKIFSRWIPAFGRPIALRLNDIQLGRFVDPPRLFSFGAFRFGPENIVLGGGYRIAAWPIQDITGAATNAPIQVTRLNPKADRFEIEAEEMLFKPFDPDDLINRVIIVDSNVNNFDLREVHDTLYPVVTEDDVNASPPVTLTCIVEAGVIVGSNFTSVAAFKAGDPGDWPAGFQITLEVIGRIQGKGGNGASGASNDGFPGGPALFTRHAIDLAAEDGEIWGGGGGGASSPQRPGGHIGGGGGGAGQLPGLGGDGSGAGEDGGDGTTEHGGLGGSDTIQDAGDGGDPGQDGQDDLAASGGAAGSAINGVSFVTVIDAGGDIRGPQIN